MNGTDDWCCNGEFYCSNDGEDYAITMGGIMCPSMNNTDWTDIMDPNKWNTTDQNSTEQTMSSPICPKSGLSAECCDDDGDCMDGTDFWCCDDEHYCSNHDSLWSGILCAAQIDMNFTDWTDDDDSQINDQPGYRYCMDTKKVNGWTFNLHRYEDE